MSAADHDADWIVIGSGFGFGGSVMKLLFTALADQGSRWTRPLKPLGSMQRHPLQALKTLRLRRWGQRTLTR